MVGFGYPPPYQVEEYVIPLAWYWYSLSPGPCSWVMPRCVAILIAARFRCRIPRSKPGSFHIIDKCTVSIYNRDVDPHCLYVDTDLKTTNRYLKQLYI